MPFPDDCIEITFDGPAMYRITVKGRLDARFSENLGDMRISNQPHENGTAVTILQGKVRDQAELMGILEGIYDGTHMPILSVESWGATDV